MIKKLLLILSSLIFINSCGYQPIYVNKDVKNTEFFEISLEGDKEVNRKIINSLSIKKNEFDSRLGELFIESVYTIDEVSKNSKGQVISYRSKIEVGLIIKEGEKVIKDVSFIEEFTYNNRDNKFELTEYQKDVKNNIVIKILERIIVSLNV